MKQVLTTPRAPSAATWLRGLGLEADDWQAKVLDGNERRLLVNTCRGAGKSTLAAALGLRQALWIPDALVLLLSRSARRGQLLYERVRTLHERIGEPLLQEAGARTLVFANRSRLVCLPAADAPLRDYADVSLLIVDDAARVADDLFRAAQVRLALPRGRLLCLSTPLGRRGFFYELWQRGAEWTRQEVPLPRVPRLERERAAAQRQTLGETWYRQEYCCAFDKLVGLVYPEFARCVTPGMLPEGKWVGGLDFGLRSPFAAVWGVLDKEGVLWLRDEHYEREQPLAYHVKQLPPDVTWYADPAGAREILELRCAGLTVHKGERGNAGLAAILSRLRDGRLRVLEGCCPNLRAEAALYRLDPRSGFRQPIKEHDHALDALRYLASKLD